jgi:hypothetical protein
MKGDSKDTKLARNIIIIAVAVFIGLFCFRVHIFAFFQNQFFSAVSPFFGLLWFQIINLIVCILFFSFFSFLGYKKAKQKKLNPTIWALVCFIFNLWGYVFLLYCKSPKKREV